MTSFLPPQGQISKDLQQNLDRLHTIFFQSPDVVIRAFCLGNGQKAALFYVDGLVNQDMLGRDFFPHLLQAKRYGDYSVKDLAEEALCIGEVSFTTSFNVMLETVLQGLTALLVDGDDQALCVQAISWPQRSVAEPGTDVVIRGPREGFIEGMRSNLSLLRKKIHHPDLAVEILRVGRYSRTDIALAYVKSIVRKDVLHEVKRRLKKIDIDAILDSGYVEQLIQDTPYSLFPTIGITEKPDIAAAHILEGRVVLLVDGSPIALTLPMLFVEGLHSPEDHYTRFYYASWVRVIRVIAFLISIYLPGFFLAATCYHQQIIPFNLMVSMSVAEAKTPFSAGLSLLLIGLAYELLREAGIRLPKPAGQAISIVGAIVMGDAAVSAQLITAYVLIVLAITVIASFVSSVYADASTLLRLIFLFLGWVLGFYGLFLGTMILLVYLCSLESFGVPFFAPFAPLERSGLKDAVIRFPLWKLKFRPRDLSHNRRRMSDHTDPVQKGGAARESKN